MIVAAIAAPGDRSHQIKIGPSGLGDPCDRCVALQMNHRLHPEQFVPSRGSLPTWIGTAIHFFLENTLVGRQWDAVGTHRELSNLYIGTIPGYGKIKGTTDVYSEEFATAVDYKGSKMAKVRSYKFSGIPQTHEYQRQMYGRGIERLGLPIKYVANLYIPRDGFGFDDMWFDIAEYDPDKADRAIARATTIYQDYVVPGRIDELGSDEDCFTCTSMPSSRLPKVKFVRRNKA